MLFLSSLSGTLKNIPVLNKLSKVIIAKDLTIQQRDQNKKKRELKNKNNKQSLQKIKLVR